MKGLTMNRLALAGLRANRKEYRQMALGIFLAVFLAVGTALGLWTIWEKQAAVRRIRFGQADGLFYRVQVLEPDTLRNTGMVSRVGTVSILGRSGDFRFGFFDEDAESILQRQFLSGGMPQSADEVALNEQAWNALCPEAAPGDTVTLRLVPTVGSSQNREFILSGVFRSEAHTAVSDWDVLSLLSESLGCIPDILVYRDAPEFQNGKQEREYVFTLAPHSSIEALFARLPYSNLVGIDFLGTPFRPGDSNGGGTLRKLLSLEYVSPVLLTGGALLLAAMIGIFDAASGQFARKERQYRLLQAVGATRAQIRVVSRREAMLLALVLAPGAALWAVGFVKLCCRLLPEAATCSVPPRLILGSILAAFLLVWIAASLPAFWALRRGTPATKARRRHSRKQFVPARLLSLRNLRQHPVRFLGSVILVVLLNVTATLFFISNQEKVDTLRCYEEAPSFLARHILPGRESSLTEEKLRSLHALPGISQMTVSRCAPVYALTDTVGDYLPALGMSNYHLRTYRPDLTGDWVYDAPDAYIQGDVGTHRQIEEFLGTDKISISLYLFTVADAQSLAPFLQEGTIDQEALDSGRSVLVLAPDYYIKSQRSEHSYSYSRSTEPMEDYDRLVENDQFPLGAQLTFAQLRPDPWFTLNTTNTTLKDAQATTCQARIDGILTELRNSVWDSWDATSIVTTVEGAKVLGLDPGPVQYLTFQMDGSLSDQVLESKIGAILGKDGDYQLTNIPESLRSARKSFALYTLFLGSLFLAFLTCTVTLLRGSRIRDIQAKADTIHILWSLGCEDRDLAAIWQREILYVFLVGFLISIAVELLLMRPTVFWGLKDYLFFSGISSILGAGLCLIGVKHTLQQCMEIEK